MRSLPPVVLALSVLLMAACDDELVGPGWWDRLLAISGAPPSQEQWTAIRPYRFAHDTLRIRVGQRIPIGRPCEPRPGLACTPTTSDTAAVATWIRHVALTTCARNPEPECRTDTQGQEFVWLGDPPPWVPWAEAVDSGFVAVTDRETLEGVAAVLPGCQVAAVLPGSDALSRRPAAAWFSGCRAACSSRFRTPRTAAPLTSPA